MNIIIVGDSSSVFIKNYCMYVLTERDSIYIFSYTNTGRFSDLYEKMGIKEIYIMPFLENSPLRVTNIVSVLYKKTKEIKKTLPSGISIDVIHVHYVIPSTLVYLFAFWFGARVRILTFWGSDILRASDSNRKLLTPFLIMASTITFMIQTQKQFFCNKYGNRFDRKIKIIDFGNALLDVIDDIRAEYSKADCKQELGLRNDKIIIHIGYNKEEGQQHIKILEQLCLLPQHILKKIQIVFPWGYGGKNVNEDIYISKIENMLETYDIDYVFVKSFLQGEELAKFRMSCDIFLYGQISDAMSASPLEYVYSGGLFLCPDWLWENYALINWQAEQCFKYFDFTHMRNVLNEILLKWEEPFLGLIENEMHEIIYENLSWENLSPIWRKCYERH